MTRNTVQKSLVAVMTLPLFNLVEDHLKACVTVIFKEQNFEDVALFKMLHESLTHTLRARISLDDQVPLGDFLQCVYFIY